MQALVKIRQCAPAAADDHTVVAMLPTRDGAVLGVAFPVQLAPMVRRGADIYITPVASGWLVSLTDPQHTAEDDLVTAFLSDKEADRVNFRPRCPVQQALDEMDHIEELRGVVDNTRLQLGRVRRRLEDLKVRETVAAYDPTLRRLSPQEIDYPELC